MPVYVYLIRELWLRISEAHPIRVQSPRRRNSTKLIKASLERYAVSKKDVNEKIMNANKR